MARMVKGLKSGNEEGQLASRALAFLGVAAKDSNGVFRDTGEIVIDIAKALSQYADDGNKVALVQDALGKGAQKYLPYLKDIVEFNAQAATTTAEQARQAKEFEVAVNRVNFALEEGRRHLVVEYTPALTRMIDQMREGIPSPAASGRRSGTSAPSTRRRAWPRTSAPRRSRWPTGSRAAA
jgi:hypothetical protein